MKTILTILLITVALTAKGQINPDKWHRQQANKRCTEYKPELLLPKGCESYHKFKVKSVCAAGMGVVVCFICPYVGVSMIVMDAINYKRKTWI